MESATVILQLVISLLRAAGWLEQVPELTSAPSESAIHRLLYSVDLTTPLQQIVRKSGYQRDHLNRLASALPGEYFVFDQRTRQVVASVDRFDRDRRRQSVR